MSMIADVFVVEEMIVEGVNRTDVVCLVVDDVPGVVAVGIGVVAVAAVESIQVSVRLSAFGCTLVSLAMPLS